MGPRQRRGRPAARSPSSSRRATRSTSDRPGSASRRPTPTGTTVYATGRARQPAGVLRLLRRRPTRARYAETTLTVPVDGRPLPITLRAWPDDPAWAKRVGGLLERGLPALAEAIGLPWTADRPLDRGRGGQPAARPASPAATTPTARPIEIAYYADQFVILHEAAHAWFDGGLLADRWANEGFASWYALDAAATAEAEGRAGEPLTPELDRRPDPAQRLGPARAPTTRRPRTTATRRRRELAGLDRRAGRTATASRRSGRRSATGSRAYQPTGLRSPDGAATNGTGGASMPGSDVAPIETRPTAARLARPPRPARGPDRARATTTCGGRGSSATRRPGCSTRGRRRGASTTRSWPRPASGGCRRSSATRCASWQFGQATQLLDGGEPRARRPRRGARDGVGGGPDACPDALRGRVRGQPRLRRGVDRGGGGAGDDPGLRRGRRGRARATRGSSSRSGCGARRRRRTSRQPPPRSRRATSARRSRRAPTRSTRGTAPSRPAGTG